MKRMMNINVLESNENFVHPSDEIEQGLNLVGSLENGEYGSENMKNLFYLLEKSRSRLFKNHELKQGLIYLFMGELYLKKKELSFARYAFEISRELLSGYQTLSSRVKSRLLRVREKEAFPEG